MARSKGTRIIDPTDIDIRQEDLQYYFELTAFRKGRSFLVRNPTDLQSRSIGDNTVIKFNAANQQTNLHTTDWTNFDSQTDELFGIKDVTIKQTLNYIQLVSITFQDIRGKSLLSREENSPYTYLFDLPLGLYRMKYKGYYGKAVETKLILSKPPQITFDAATGNASIKAEFTSYTFAILREIKVDYILKAPFIQSVLSNVDNSGITVQTDNPETSSYNSTLQLVEAAKSIARVFERYSENTSQTEALDEINNSIKKYLELNRLRNSFEDFVKSKNLRYSLLQSSFNILTNTSNIEDDINKTLLRLIDKIKKYNTENNINVSTIAEDFGTIYIDSNNNQTEGTTLIVNGLGIQFNDKINSKLDELYQQEKDLSKKINQELENQVQQALGFKPTIRNIVKIIADDADKFLSIFRDICLKAEIYHKENNTATSNNIRENQVYAFPTYVETNFYNSLDPLQLPEGNTNASTVDKYPGTVETFKNEWFECQFVEAYLKASTNIESIINSTGNTDTNLNTSANQAQYYIPLITEEEINPYQLISLNDGDKIIVNLIKRYLIVKKFVYSLNDMDEQLLNYISRAEAFNLTDKIRNTIGLRQFITLIEEQGNNALTSILTNANYSETTNFLNSLNTTNNIDFNERIYSLKTNSTYQSLQLEFSDGSLNKFTDTPRSSYNSIVKSLNINNTFIRNNLFNGRDTQSYKGFTSNNGFIAYPDNLYRENEAKTWRSDYIIKSPNGQVLTEYGISFSNYENLLLTFANQNISNKDKIKSFVNLFYINNLRETLGVPSIHEVPFSYLIQIENINSNQSILSSNDAITLNTFIDSFITNIYQNINTIISDVNSWEITDIGNYILKEPLRRRVFSQLSNIVYMKINSVDTFSLLDTTINQNYNVSIDELNNYLILLNKELKKYVSENSNNNQVVVPIVDSGVQSDELKYEIYRDFQTFYTKWISGDDDYFNGNPIISYFRFIDRAGRDIGDKCMVNFEPMVNMFKTSNSRNLSMYEILVKLFTTNNFNFFPIENFISFENENTSSENAWNLENIFTPQTNVAVKSQPSFTVQYVGGTSSFLNIERPNESQTNDDSINVCSENFTLPTDMEDGFVQAFIISYGIQNQGFFKGFNVATDQHTNTREYYQVVDQLANLGANRVQSQRIGQNLINVYELQSYKMTIESMGNGMLQPMQYYFLCGVPIFNGLYMITDVSHSIGQGKFTTSFTGVRMPRFPKPLVTNYVANIKSIYEQIRRSRTTGNTTSSTTAPNISDGTFILPSTNNVSDVFGNAIVPPQGVVNTLSFEQTLIQFSNRF